MVKTYFYLLIITLFCNYKLFSQNLDLQPFEKKFDLSNGISNDQEDILIHRGKIFTANIHGVEIFNGLSWVRDRLTGKSSQLQYVYHLYKDKDDPTHIYLIANNFLGEYKINKLGKYQFQELIDLRGTNNIGYVLNVYEKNGLIIFLGDKGLIIFNKRTHQFQKHQIPQLKKTFFLDHFIDNKIILNEVGGRTFSWNYRERRWEGINNYPFFNKLKIQYTLELKNGNILIVTTKGKVFLERQNQGLILEDSLTTECRRGYSFKVIEKNGLLYIKMHNKFLVYDLNSKKVLLKKMFSVRISSFKVSEAGNIWLSTIGKGVYFIEYNSIFLHQSNTDQIYRQFYIDNEIFTLRKNKTELEIKSGKGQVNEYNLGWIWNIKRIGNRVFICSSKGIFRKEIGHNDIDKIYNEECFNIQSLISKQLLVLCNNKAVVLDKENFKKTSQININGKLINSIEFGNLIYIATENQCFKINLSSKQIDKIIESNKSEGIFNFVKFDQKLLIHNVDNLYAYSTQQGIKSLTQQITGLPYNQNKALVKFTNVLKLNNDSLLIVPVLGGEYNGLNLPGLIIKTNDKYVWQNKLYQRLGKYEMDNLTKVSTNKYQIITPVSIIEFDPYKRIGTSTPFDTYIQEVQINPSKLGIIQVQNSQKIRTDSSIYFGNTSKQIVHKLDYQYNSISFTYTSNNWSAYERNEYSYQLVGQDETWSNWGKAQKKEYTNIGEGTYTFKVRCKNVYGTISSVAAYTFTILPPWYRTWWAYLMYGLVAIGILTGGSVGYSRFRTRQIRRRNQELEKVVTERTEEIRTQQEELKTTNEELVKANKRIQEERDEKVKIYLQEATEATSKLQEIRDTLAEKGAETTEKMLSAEINTAGEFVIIRDKVRKEFPDFAEQIDQALADKKITKLLWQVGHCLKLGMSPLEVAEVLPTTNRSVSVHGTKLRKLGILEELKK